MTKEERKRQRQERVAKRHAAKVAEDARRQKDNQAYYQSGSDWKMPRGVIRKIV